MPYASPFFVPFDLAPRISLLSWLWPRDQLPPQANPSHLPALVSPIVETHYVERLGALVRVLSNVRPGNPSWLQGNLLRATLLDAAQWSAAGRPSMVHPASADGSPMVAAGVRGESRRIDCDPFATLAEVAAGLDGVSVVVLAIENDRIASTMPSPKRAFVECFDVFAVT